MSCIHMLSQPFVHLQKHNPGPTLWPRQTGGGRVRTVHMCVMAAPFDMMQLEAFFCSAKFTSDIGDFMARRGPDLDFRPLEEEQPLG